MPRPLTHRLGAVALILAVWVSTPPSHAGELPPKQSPAYTGVYQARVRTKDHPGENWDHTTEETVTIAVLAKQSRWDHKSDGHTLITDYVSRFVTQFGGQASANTANRTRSPFLPISWEFGYATVAAATERDPEVVGKATIAGHPCTRLRYVSDQYGEPEYCVTKTGIVVSFTNRSATGEVSYEAQSIDEKPPDPGLFSVPAGYKVEDHQLPRLR